VRPLIEYGSALWANQSKKCLKLVEGVQKKATKYILNDFNTTYKERLIQCNILPLSYRYEYLDLVLIYNSMNNLNCINLSSIVMFANNSTTRSGDKEAMLVVKRVNLDTYNRFYSNRIVRIWNLLPEDIRLCELTDSGKNTMFKTRVKNLYMSKLREDFDDSDTCSWVSHCLCSRCKVC
jgi:hypothetical protein